MCELQRTVSLLKSVRVCHICTPGMSVFSVIQSHCSFYSRKIFTCYLQQCDKAAGNNMEVFLPRHERICDVHHDLGAAKVGRTRPSQQPIERTINVLW